MKNMLLILTIIFSSLVIAQKQESGYTLNQAISAAEKGNADVMCKLGAMYYSGNGVSQDYNKALYWYNKAAEKGNGDAMNNIGVMCLDALGFSSEYKVVLTYYVVRQN